MQARVSFKVLFVCTANECRSPLAEFALRRRCIEHALPWNVASAGIKAVPGLPPDPHVRVILDSYGDDYTAWCSRPLTVGMVQEADLILTATQAHRSRITTIRPDRARCTYPLLLFSWWCSQIAWPLIPPAASGEALTEAVERSRPYLPPLRSGLDVADPIGRSMRVFRRCDRVISNAIDQIIGEPTSMGSS